MPFMRELENFSSGRVPDDWSEKHVPFTQQAVCRDLVQLIGKEGRSRITSAFSERLPPHAEAP